MSFARSLNKAQGFLMPYRRPQIGRTLSNSSDLSLTSNQSGRSEDFGGDGATSAPGTPDGGGGALFAQHGPVSSACTSRPINIEMPKSRKSATTVYTHTETLSARGDLPGGYFPMHEDPSCRIRPTHPFHSDTRHRNSDSKVAAAMHDTREYSTSSVTTAWQAAHTPLSSTTSSSYMASAATATATAMHHHPLPVGKYYPSIYEKRSQHQKSQRGLVAESVTSYAKADAQGTTYNKGPDDARQRLQQYQRDMIAQASMVLGTSYNANVRPGNALTPRHLSVPDVRIAAPLIPHRPISPQLQPLGSPGPVTPMDLEAKEEYMTTAKDKENLAPPVGEFTPHSL